MTAVAQVKAPLLSVERPKFGVALAEAEGNIKKMPLLVTVTEHEIYIAWADRDGPSFVIEMKPLIKAAMNEIEDLLGIGQGIRK
jgi:hypothetical protein